MEDLPQFVADPIRDGTHQEALLCARLSVFPVYTCRCVSTRVLLKRHDALPRLLVVKTVGGAHVITKLRKPFLQRQHRLAM